MRFNLGTTALIKGPHVAESSTSDHDTQRPQEGNPIGTAVRSDTPAPRGNGDSDKGDTVNERKPE